MYEIFCSSNDSSWLFRATPGALRCILSFKFKSLPFECKPSKCIMCKFAIINERN